MDKACKVAIVQARPVYYNLPESMKKALEWTKKAAKEGARLVVFGETWLPGYPAWLDHCRDVAYWDHPSVKKVFATLRENSVVVGGSHTRQLAEAAGDLKINLVIGINERVDEAPGNRTLYNSILFFGEDGKLTNHHRKLMPTYTERLVWGQGDGRGLHAVNTSVGRVGGLICWEHWMPLARQALHNSGEHIHLALWPTVNRMHQIASIHYAFEGRCFVLAAGSLMPARDLPAELEWKPELKKKPDTLLLRGGSTVIGPNGRYVVGPVFDEEKIIIAELDLTQIDREALTLDVSGHYSRPDVFEFGVKEK